MVSTEVHEQATATTLAATHTSTGTHRGVEPRVDPVVLVHGFTQNRDCWGPLGDALRVRAPLSALDAPGHGGSEQHRSSDVAASGDLIAETARRWGEPVVLVGYSMGARMCLRAALDHPDVVAGVVLVGGTAGIEDSEERSARRRRDDATASELESVGVTAFLDGWLSMPMFERLPQWAHFDDERSSNTVDGLAASLRNAGTGSMEPLWDRLGELRAPLLCVTGELDERFGGYAQRMVDLATESPSATHTVIGGAGHAAHLEAPDEATERILEALEEWSARASGR